MLQFDDVVATLRHSGLLLLLQRLFVERMAKTAKGSRIRKNRASKHCSRHASKLSTQRQYEPGTRAGEQVQGAKFIQASRVETARNKINKCTQHPAGALLVRSSSCWMHFGAKSRYSSSTDSQVGAKDDTAVYCCWLVLARLQLLLFLIRTAAAAHHGGCRFSEMGGISLSYNHTWYSVPYLVSYSSSMNSYLVLYIPVPGTILLDCWEMSQYLYWYVRTGLILICLREDAPAAAPAAAPTAAAAAAQLKLRRYLVYDRI